MKDDEKREFLRHTVATVAYRGGKAIAGAPEAFGDFKAFESTRTPLQILAHVGDLFDWALSMARGETVWNDTEPLPWNQETERFFAAVKAFDEFIASDNEIAKPLERLFQGPVADALTHVGQINLLRRMFDAPVKGENYYRAEIEIGRVGAEQSANRVEFD
jgi:hypothetical protein